MRISPTTRFTEHLESLGIRVHGVRGSGPDALIDFTDENTAQQRLTALAARATFDWSEMDEMDDVEIDVSLLTSSQRQAILNRIIANYLKRHPRLAAALGVIVTKKV